MSPHVGITFVHGFLSSVKVWSGFQRLISADPQLAECSTHTFGYRSPAFSLHPLRRIPRLPELGDGLRTFLTERLPDQRPVVLVSHSQGGLVVQQLLAQAVADDDRALLSRIRLVVMFACPHAGSDLLLPLRRAAWFWRNPQERHLRPLQAAVTRAQRVVLNRVVHGAGDTRVVVYAADSDAVVPPAVALGVFPDGGTLPGDHSSIIQPDSHAHPSYTALRHQLTQLTAPPVLPLQRSVSDPVAAPTRPAAVAGPGPVAAGPDRIAYQRLAADLLAVPGSDDPAWRQQLYRLLPGPVRQHLPRNSVAHTELLGVLMTIEDYRESGAWEALAEAVRVLAPHHPAAARFQASLVEQGLVRPPAPEA
ncbi:DUF3089 domain-containing protein [Natronosporangium hydrolyticum]|uniref:DUF3089 domain-containing protein n=1 Tax=Natronosporangium hydrolyticum TaxID=2811111 RepID=A0A895YJW1_9ACTN|nr:DUF3089 domain-containing protein [Natronosporangium hydrolyticum]QSB15799.1 DUF3089 domain-containing protein [Natronosporangium hydrolyticum]